MQVTSEVPACAHCGAQDKQLSACSQCHVTQYCNRTCQTMHWKVGHKKVCVLKPPSDKQPLGTNVDVHHVQEGINPTIGTLPLSTSVTLDVKTKPRETKKAAPTIECGFCNAQGPSLKPCSRCMLTYYCNKACQAAHWKESHKLVCIPLHQRAIPKPTKYTPHPSESGDECAICLSPIFAAAACILLCKHMFHRECVAGLRKFGVAQVCPICRADIPDSPEKLFDEAMRRFFVLNGKVERGEASWKALTSAEQIEIDEVLQSLRELADQGNVLAQFNIGLMHYNGQGVKQGITDALSWYQKAAEQGCVEAQYTIGMMYFEGQGVKKSETEALSWFLKASKQGHIRSQYTIGIMYVHGLSLKQSYTEAFLWFRKAADQGDAESQFNIGVFYDKGHGVKQSYTEALSWYRKAAEQGVREAQLNIGVLYLTVKQNDTEAFSWFRKAAEQGDAQAQFNLGGLYYNGKGIKESFTEALLWFRKAAEQGHANAFFSIGFLYEHGHGVKKDIDQSLRWYRKAADQGHPEAIVKLLR